MDILDPLEKILDIAVALKELVDIFKSKDKWFETCYLYLNSIIETMEKYKKTRNPKKKLPEACILLQGELDAFKELLEKEKKRSSFAAFFRGSTMVKESQEQMSAIEKQIHNFNLALNIDNQIETNENFVKMLTISNPSSSIKAKFTNPKAADMWMRNFFNEEQVSWTAFTSAMKEFALATEKIELTESQLEIIVTAMDTDQDRLILYQEWDRFFSEKWNDPSQRKIILTKHSIERKNTRTIPSLTLKLTQRCSLESKTYLYPVGHEFFISEAKVMFQDYEGTEITSIKNWAKEALVVGKLKQGVFKPDIYYHPKASSIKEKQFQLSLKKLPSAKGFYLNNLSFSSPTSLKIENIDYVVSSGMIFDLAETLIEIADIEPELNINSLDEDNPDYFFVNFQEAKEEEEGNEATIKVKRSRGKKKANAEDSPIKKKGKSAMPLPSITLNILQGVDQDKKPLVFTLNNPKEQKIITIGSGKDCDIIIEDLEEAQLKIRWEPSLKNWMAFNDKANNGEKGGAYLYLVKGNEFKEGQVKQGKLSVKLRDKMKLAFGYNEMEVKID